MSCLIRGLYTKWLLLLAVGVIGACGQLNGRSVNLGFVQSSLRAGSDGSISIVYQNGDKCGSGGRYSTRVIFQCDDSPVSTISLFDLSAVSQLVSFALFCVWNFLLLMKKGGKRIAGEQKQHFCSFAIWRVRRCLTVRMAVNTSSSGGPPRHARLREYKVPNDPSGFKNRLPKYTYIFSFFFGVFGTWLTIIVRVYVCSLSNPTKDRVLVCSNHITCVRKSTGSERSRWCRLLFTRLAILLLACSVLTRNVLQVCEQKFHRSRWFLLSCMWEEWAVRYGAHRTKKRRVN